MPLTKNPTPHSIATTQKEMTGIPNTIIRPTKNKTTVLKIFEPHKLKTFFICDIKDAEQILSSKKYTPVKAISQSKLTFGTNRSKIPIVSTNTPINIFKKMFETYPLLRKAVTIL